MGYENHDSIESLHLEFCEYNMKVKLCSSNCIVNGDLGRVPISNSIRARIIGLWEQTRKNFTETSWHQV